METQTYRDTSQSLTKPQQRFMELGQSGCVRQLSRRTPRHSCRFLAHQKSGLDQR